MRYIWVLLVALLIVGCQDNAEVDDPQVEEPTTSVDEDKEEEEAEPDPVEEQQETEPEQVNEEVKTATEFESEPVNNQVINVTEARVIAEENLAKSIELMQDIQIEHSDWFGVEEESDAYVEGVKETKSALSNTISEAAVDEWAATYFEEFFMYNHLYKVLHPSQLNTHFELKEFTEDKFTLSFIQLGDEAFMGTEHYDLTYVKEGDQWKFNGYDSGQVNRDLNLSEEDLMHAFLNYETLERLKGELVDEQQHDGDKYLIMEYGDMLKAINSRTGVIDPFFLDDTES
ncbi:hypothetical protein [Piscibacillus halophilus]|uniref:hypothetical protein n=1 Tax=Piscibacillus halophilus TaxID=571933 RepID=UPI00240905FD|nr:hypothetical protein [Piscibacillus halophilus]